MATNKENYQRLKAKLEIDRNRLDEALIEQPALFDEVSEQYIRWLSERDRWKDDLKRTRAEVYIEVRKKAEEQGTRITEGTVDALIEDNDDYRAAVDGVRATTKEAKRWEALKEAFMQRAQVIREVASLWVAGYFATDAVRTGNVREVEDRLYEESKAKAKESRGRRKQNRKDR